jgi:hypothetical protein
MERSDRHKNERSSMCQSAAPCYGFLSLGLAAFIKLITASSTFGSIISELKLLKELSEEIFQCWKTSFISSGDALSPNACS